MDTKWLVIYGIVIVVIACAGETYSDYTKSDCVKAYASSTLTAYDIAKVCRVK